MRRKGEDINEPKKVPTSPGEKPEVKMRNPTEDDRRDEENGSGESPENDTETAAAADGPIMEKLDQLCTGMQELKSEIHGGAMAKDLKHVKRGLLKVSTSKCTAAKDVEIIKIEMQDHKQRIEDHKQRIEEIEKFIKTHGSQCNSDQEQDQDDQPENLNLNPGNDSDAENDDTGIASDEEDLIVVPQPPPVPVNLELPPAEPEHDPVVEEPKTKRQRRAATDSTNKTKQVIQQGRRKFTPAFREKAAKRVGKFMAENMSLHAAVTATLEKYQVKDIGRPNLMRWVRSEASTNPNGTLAKLLAADKKK